MNLVGILWVLDPGSHVGGNVVVGLGMTAPTGVEWAVPTSTHRAPALPIFFLPQVARRYLFPEPTVMTGAEEAAP
ncbi:MAG: hypothetical protein ACREL5_09175 [Gemmatimonadales bacterium]